MIRKLFCVAIAAAAAMAANAAPATNLSGPIRGVALEYLNGQNQDIDWMLDQFNKPQPSNPDPQISSWTPNYNTQAVLELNNMFAADQAAGVNYFFVMIDPRFIGLYCQSRLSDETSYCYDPGDGHGNLKYPYPAINPRLIVAMQNLLNMTNSGRFAGQFKVDLAVNPLATRKTGDPTFAYVCESVGGVGDTNNSNFDFPCGDNGDPSKPVFNTRFGMAEEYIYNWLTAVVTSNPGNNIGITLVGVQWDVCQISAPTVCDGDGGASAQTVNNGEAIKVLWAWEQSTFATSFPGLTASFEVVAVDGTLPSSDTTLMKSVVKWTANWLKANNLNLPYFVTPMYIQESVGSAATSYATDATIQLQAYTWAQQQYQFSTPLWIQEYGGSVGNFTTGLYKGNFTVADQENTISGTLLGFDCATSGSYPQFLWVTGNDAPSNTPVNGMINGFSTISNAPLFQPAWWSLNQWYNDGASVNPIPVSVPANGVTGGILPGTCPANPGDPLQFVVTTPPSNGSVSITDSGSGTFMYTSTVPSTFWGTDSFKYQWSPTSPSVTVNATIYSAPVLTVIVNSVL